MTTHDYQGETNPSLTQVDPATANDPGWQRPTSLKKSLVTPGLRRSRSVT